MPGIVLLSRRWAIGSDDFVVPCTPLILLHTSWIATYLINIIQHQTFFPFERCTKLLSLHLLGCFFILTGELFVEICIVIVSFRGTILNSNPRKTFKPLLWIRILLFFIEFSWEIYGVLMIAHGSIHCDDKTKELVILLKILNGISVFIFGFSIWCSYDPAGRSWVKMKRFQESLKNPKIHYKRSQSVDRSWRYRKAMADYEKSWQNRCRNFFCLLTFKTNRDKSFGDIAKLLSEFFRGLDVVPSDVIAGLSLMRARQKVLLKEQLKQSSLNAAEPLENIPGTSSSVPQVQNKRIFEFLSGIPITSKTDFLDLMHPLVVQEIENLIHFFHYSLAIYGWPMYMMNNSPKKWCKLCKFSTCFCCLCCYSNLRQDIIGFERHFEQDTIVDHDRDVENPEELFVGDNCCDCNRAAIQETCIEHNYKIVYMNYAVHVGKPPFFVAVDFDKMSIVISIRGTLSVYDVITDLNAEYEPLPVYPANEEFYGHKGMIGAASYVLEKLREKRIIKRATKELKAQDRGCGSYQNQHEIQYPIIVVGHSLGAGTAAILTILLKQTYSNVMCFAFAPPGGLLSLKAAEYSRDFVVSVVHGKDCVPRLGLHQMEKMRFDLIKTIKHCNLSKWSIITQSCCYLRRSREKDISLQSFNQEFKMNPGYDDDHDPINDENDDDRDNIAHTRNVNLRRFDSSASASRDRSKHSNNRKRDPRTLSVHPNDDTVCLTVHDPLYPPGSVIHLVRSHPNQKSLVGKRDTLIQAVWTNFQDYQEIIISPTMIRDHMPDQMLKAMYDLLQSSGSPRRHSFKEDNAHEGTGEPSDRSSSTESNTPSRCQHVETSFANAFDQAANDIERRFSNLNEQRLKRLRSLVRKGRAPLAEDESWSIADDGSTETGPPDGDRQDEGDAFKPDGKLSQQAHPPSIIIDPTTNETGLGEKAVF